MSSVRLGRGEEGTACDGKRRWLCDGGLGRERRDGGVEGVLWSWGWSGGGTDAGIGRFGGGSAGLFVRGLRGGMIGVCCWEV